MPNAKHVPAEFRSTLKSLVAKAGEILGAGRKAAAGQKPEEFTKDKLIAPFLEALGYGPDERMLEGAIKGVSGARNWVDYFLMPEKNRPPWCMVEAKSIFDKDIWTKNKKQTIEYLVDHQDEVGRKGVQPVKWILLTNFAEWQFVFLSDSQPYWTLHLDELEANADELYDRLAREHCGRDRMLEFYMEREGKDLGPRFLADLKVWRLAIANGIRDAEPRIDILDVRRYSQQLLNRLLFIRLLEAYGQEAYNSVATCYEIWQSTYDAIPFAQFLATTRIHATWLRYNTELFRTGVLDEIEIDSGWFVPVLMREKKLEARVASVLGEFWGGRSIYSYDFTTLTQDVLGKAYEQFLAHELQEAGGGQIRILENQATRQREGIFYTPDYVVTYIVRQTLGPRVEACVDQAKGLLSEAKYSEAHAAILEIVKLRVVDPACGSGSFLQGALAYLADALDRYNQAAGRHWQDKSAKVDPSAGLFGSVVAKPIVVENPVELVLVNCIYGVDLDAEAVDLAKLSLWSRLLRSKPGYYGGKNRKENGKTSEAHLPVLSLNLRQGNSLFDAPVAADEFSTERQEAADLTRLAQAVEKSDKERLAAAKSADAIVSEIRETIRPRVQWGDHESTDAAVRTRRATFNWELEFPGVFDARVAREAQGFDAVIGNPPYFNVDSTWGKGAAELSYLRTRYADIATDKTDILFYFFRRGFDLLRADGELSFIVSRAFLQGDKSKRLRMFLQEHATLLHLLDFLGQRVFQAGIATAILHFRNAKPAPDHKLDVRCVLDLTTARQRLQEGKTPKAKTVTLEVEQATLDGGRWLISPYAHYFEQLDRGRGSIRSAFKVGQGMQTGENAVFVLDAADVQKHKIPVAELRKRVSNENPCV